VAETETLEILVAAKLVELQVQKLQLQKGDVLVFRLPHDFSDELVRLCLEVAQLIHEKTGIHCVALPQVVGLEIVSSEEAQAGA
jgi:hypothetical protein